MTDTVCQIEALTLLRTKLAEPGVLYGPQRMQEFIDKIMMVATTMVTRHTKAVREFADLGCPHRFPFAKRAVAKLCGVIADTIPRVIKILLKVEFLAEKSETKRWYEVGSRRSATLGAKAYWVRPSIFQFGPQISRILAGTDLAVPPVANQCAPDVIPLLQPLELDDCTDQLIEEIEERDMETIWGALPSSIPTGFDDDTADIAPTGFGDTADDAAEAPLEVCRRPNGPKIRMPMPTPPKIPMPVMSLPVVEERPQPEPAPAKPLTEFDINLARILREVAEAKQGG